MGRRLMWSWTRRMRAIVVGETSCPDTLRGVIVHEYSTSLNKSMLNLKYLPPAYSLSGCWQVIISEISNVAPQPRCELGSTRRA